MMDVSAVEWLGCMLLVPGNVSCAAIAESGWAEIKGASSKYVVAANKV